MKKEIKTKSVFAHYKLAIQKKSFVVLVINGIVFAISAYIGNVLAPTYYKGIVDAITTGEPKGVVLHFFYLIIGAGVLQTLFSRIYEYFESRSISKILKDVMNYGMNKLTNHSYQFFANNFAGSLITKTKRFAKSADTMIEMIMRDFIFAAVSVVGILIILTRTSSLLAVVALFWFVVFFGFMIYATRKRIPLERASSLMESKVTGVLSDIITNVLNLKIFSSKQREEKYFSSVLEEEHKIRSKAWDYASRSYNIQSIITLLAKTSLIALSVFLWLKGISTPGTIILIISYSTILFDRLGYLGSAIRRFIDAYINAAEFTELLDQQIEIVDPKNPEESKIKSGEVKFNQTTFAYNKNSNVIENLKLDIRSGEKVGIIGTSGAGKTTITKLLLRFADVTGGSITIDGQDIRSITQDDLRRAISYVPQDPILFHRTLRENIAYGKVDATLEEVVRASKEAHADDFISSLPLGYDTLVGERGIKLSGGERQRVAIARAILKNAPILLLDEATSALDSVSEMHIKEALNRLMEGKTTIVIAHRLSTIEKMDRIIVLEKGKIVEEGGHKELLAKKGTYFNFWNHQNGGFISDAE